MNKLTTVAALVTALTVSTAAQAWNKRSPILKVGETLMPGDQMLSRNEVYEITMQYDGNLVERKRLGMGPNGVMVTEFTGWHSNTAGKNNAYAVMQLDGNFVIYPQGRTTGAYWSAKHYNQPNNPNYQFKLGENGNVGVEIGSPNSIYGTMVKALHWDNEADSRSETYVRYPICAPGVLSSFDSVVEDNGIYAETFAWSMYQKVLCPQGWGNGTYKVYPAGQ